GTLSDYRGAARRSYARVARRALQIADRVWFVGPNAERARREAPADGAHELCIFPTVLAAHEHLREHVRAGDLILLKGSTIDHLERLIEAELGPHACWQARCGRKVVCGECDRRLVPSLPEADAAAADELEASAQAPATDTME